MDSTFIWKCPITKERRTLTIHDALDILGVAEIPGGEQNFNVMMAGLVCCLSMSGEQHVRRNRLAIISVLERLGIESGAPNHNCHSQGQTLC